MEYNSFKLGDICRIELGKTPSRSNKKLWAENKSSNNIWLSIADLPMSIKPVMTDSKEYITDEGAELCKIVPKNTLIVSFKLSLGRLAITGCDLYTNEAIAALYINENIELEQDYLYWYLTFFDWDAAAGSDIKVKGKTLNKAKLKEIIVAIPSLQEQKRIVALLDTVFADLEQTRAKTEQNLKNARELFDSYLQQVFSQKGESWEQHKLSDLCDLISGQHIDAKNYNTDNIGIGYLTGPSDFGLLNPIVTKWTEYPKRTSIAGDILITVKGSGVGKVNIMSSDELAISRQLMAVRPTSVVGELLYWFLSMQFDYFQSLANGAAIPGISRHNVLDLELSIPKLDEQPSLLAKIKTFNSQVVRLENVYEEKIKAIGELKKSILQKAFSGELTHD